MIKTIFEEQGLFTEEGDTHYALSSCDVFYGLLVQVPVNTIFLAWYMKTQLIFQPEIAPKWCRITAGKHHPKPN